MRQFTNTANRFGIVAIFLHWVLALIIIGMLILGLYMTDQPVSLWKLKLYGWHKEWGMLVLMLVVFRIIWRISNRNPSLASLSVFERFAARAMHYAFYFFMITIPLSGWLITSAANLPVSFFGWFVIPDIIQPDEDKMKLFEVIHEWLSYGLIAAICLHVLAALKHHFINKDDILRRML
jgi:cytochrome b561